MSLQQKKLAFLSIVNSVKGFVRSVVGLPPLTLPNCVDGKSLIDCKIYGNSVQNEKNLLQYDVKTTSSNGVTWIVNNDKSITTNGTPTAWSGFNLIDRTFNSAWIGKTFTLYYPNVSVANVGLLLNFYRADGTSFTGDKFNKNLLPDILHIFTVPDEAVKIKITIQRRSNNIECTGTIYPMLLMGEYTAETLPEFADTFPSPDNPMEIESVGEKTKNLFDSVWEKGFLNTNTGKIDDTSTAAQEQVRTPHYTKLLGGTNYYLSSPTLDSSTSIAWYYYDADKNFISRQVSYNNRKITPPENTEYVKFVLRTTSLDEKIQIKEGSIATEYEPFGYKIPVVAIGAERVDKQMKNLVSNAGTTTLIERGVDWEISQMSDSAENNTPGGPAYSSGWRRIGYYDCQPDKWYKVSYDVEYLEIVAGEFSFPIKHRLVCGGIIKDVQIQEFNKIYHVDFIWKNTDADNHFTLNSCKVKVTNFKLYESDNEIKESLTNIYTKEPIRRIFNTLDTYADVVDLANKKIIRNIASIIPESSKWVSYNDGSGGKFAGKCYGIVPNAISGAGQYFNCICDKFPSARRNDMYNIGQQGIAASETVLRLIYPGLTDLPDAEFQAWVDENPIQVDYILAEPLEEIIDTSNLPTFKGTTIYEIDTNIQPSKMETTYYSTSKE